MQLLVTPFRSKRSKLGSCLALGEHTSRLDDQSLIACVSVFQWKSLSSATEPDHPRKLLFVLQRNGSGSSQCSCCCEGCQADGQAGCRGKRICVGATGWPADCATAQAGSQAVAAQPVPLTAAHPGQLTPRQSRHYCSSTAPFGWGPCNCLGFVCRLLERLIYQLSTMCSACVGLGTTNS